MEKEKKETNHAKAASVVHGDISKEKEALDENKQKLMDFRAKPGFQELTPEHQQLLEKQATAMDGYSQVLGQRISVLERDNPELAPKPKAEPKSHKKEEA